MTKTIIPSGTLLYRCSYEIKKELNKCLDTGKTGMYFSTYLLQALALCIENKQSLKLGVFKLSKDIVVYVGKYSYYELNPGYYSQKVWKPTCFALSKHNISHFDPKVYCILDIKYDILLLLNKIKTEKTHGELFIANQEELDSIDIVGEYDVPHKNLLKLFQKMKYVPDCNEYWKFIEQHNDSEYDYEMMVL